MSELRREVDRVMLGLYRSARRRILAGETSLIALTGDLRDRSKFEQLRILDQEIERLEEAAGDGG